LWAVDERRLIVSKFHFKPGSKAGDLFIIYDFIAASF
jgi:hypothetical protein